MSRLLRNYSPTFLKLIDETSRKCFGNLPIVPYRTGFKYLRRKLIGPIAIQHYPPDYTRFFRDSMKGFKTEQEGRDKDRKLRLARKGKVPPKKGQGKRASRKK